MPDTNGSQSLVAFAGLLLLFLGLLFCAIFGALNWGPSLVGMIAVAGAMVYFGR